LTPEEVAEREGDPAALTRQAYRHPWIVGAVSGGLIACWILVLGLPWSLALAVGTALFAFTGYAWRPGGPAQRWRRVLRAKDEQRFGDKESWTFTESLRAHPILFALIIGAPILLIVLLSLASSH
jgi:hypothetical protein